MHIADFIASRKDSKSQKVIGLTDYFFFGGTGSCPVPPHGLQLAIRLMAINPPLNNPCLSNAVIV